MKLVFQSSARVDKANFFSLLRTMQRAEVGRPPLAACICGSPQRGGCAVPEKTRANNYARVIIEIECRRTYLDGDRRNRRVRMRRKKTGCRVHGRKGRATAKTGHVVEKRIGPNAGLLRQMAGDSRTKVTGASADKQGVDRARFQAGGIACLPKRSRCQQGSRVLERLVEVLRIRGKQFPRRNRKMASLNSRRNPKEPSRESLLIGDPTWLKTGSTWQFASTRFACSVRREKRLPEPANTSAYRNARKQDLNGRRPERDTSVKNACPASVVKNGCMARPQNIRLAKRRFNSSRSRSRVSAQVPRPVCQVCNGSAAISADSNAIDMPLPVKGGIIPQASPRVATSSRGSCQPRRNPATPRKESGSTRAAKIRPARASRPPAHKCRSSVSIPLPERLGSNRKRPQTLTFSCSTFPKPT